MALAFDGQAHIGHLGGGQAWVLEAESESLILDHLLCPLLYDLPLLADAHVLQVVVAEANLRVQVRRELSRGLHMQPQLVMIPEDLVLLVDWWDDSIVLSCLLQIGISGLPAGTVVSSLIFVKF